MKSIRGNIVRNELFCHRSLQLDYVHGQYLFYYTRDENSLSVNVIFIVCLGGLAARTWSVEELAVNWLVNSWTVYSNVITRRDSESRYHYRAMLCIRRTVERRLSVCPTHVDILSKWLNISSNFFHRRVARQF